MAIICSPNDLLHSRANSIAKRGTKTKVTVSWFSAKDFDETKKFYTDVLGLNTFLETKGWAEFAEARGITSIGLAANPHAGKEPGATVVLEVKDIDAER